MVVCSRYITLHWAKCVSHEFSSINKCQESSRAHCEDHCAAQAHAAQQEYAGAPARAVRVSMFLWTQKFIAAEYGMEMLDKEIGKGYERMGTEAILGRTKLERNKVGRWVGCDPHWTSGTNCPYVQWFFHQFRRFMIVPRDKLEDCGGDSSKLGTIQACYASQAEAKSSSQCTSQQNNWPKAPRLHNTPFGILKLVWRRQENMEWK